MRYQSWPGNNTKSIIITYALFHPDASPREIAEWFSFRYDTVRRTLHGAGLRTNFGLRGDNPRGKHGRWGDDRQNRKGSDGRFQCATP